MEAEYDEILHWDVSGPVEPGESSMARETPWGRVSSWQVLFNH